MTSHTADSPVTSGDNTIPESPQPALVLELYKPTDHASQERQSINGVL